MVEKEIDIEILFSDFEMNLLSDKSKTRSEFQQKLLDVIYERLLHFSFSSGIRRADEIEQIGIFKNLGGHVRVIRRENLVEIVQGFALSFMQETVNLQNQDVAGSSVFNGSVRIPKPCLRIAQFFKERHVVIPGDLCKRLLHN
jgi:hypothetical protein